MHFHGFDRAFDVYPSPQPLLLQDADDPRLILRRDDVGSGRTNKYGDPVDRTYRMHPGRYLANTMVPRLRDQKCEDLVFASNDPNQSK
jgi:hypothetical protein